jgi:hypothetical protein
MNPRSLVQRGVHRLVRVLHGARGAPFRSRHERRLLVHCAHHRVGSTWFGNVLRAVGEEYGLRFQKCAQEELRPGTGIFVQDHSILDRDRLPPLWGSHMIRDPRDVIVSRYFYHLWTREAWAHIPQERYGGRSYQQYLNSLDREQGILAEIDLFIEYGLSHMVDWDYQQPEFLEIRYEEIIQNEEEGFRRLFTHYRFSEAAVTRALDIARRFSFENQTRRKVGQIQTGSHLRSGRPGEWREVLSERHVARCKEALGDALVKLRYEEGDSW